MALTNCVCSLLQPKMAGLYCNDDDPCTTSDRCDGVHYGPNACKGTPKNCAFSVPPIPALRTCYDTPYCDPNSATGECVWPVSDLCL